MSNGQLTITEWNCYRKCGYIYNWHATIHCNTTDYATMDIKLIIPGNKATFSMDLDKTFWK